MNQYILRAKDEVCGFGGYYMGKTYIHQGECYASMVSELKHAKKYKSRKRAQNTVEILNNKVWNYAFEVEEII